LEHHRRERQQHAANDCHDGPFNRRGAAGGLSEAVLGAAARGSMNGRLAAPVRRVSGDTNGPMPLRPRDSDALVARDGPRTPAEGASVERRLGETATRPRATIVRVS
jgi:hypothetical protein